MTIATTHQPSTATSAQPAGTATATPPTNSYVQVKAAAPQTGALIYVPGDNCFVALYAEEWNEISAEALEHDLLIAVLQDKNQAVSEKAVALRKAQINGVLADIQKANAELESALNELADANAAVKKKLEPLGSVKVKEGVKMVEWLPLFAPYPEEHPKADAKSGPTPGKKQKANPQFVEWKKAPSYIQSDKLKKALAERRVYIVEGAAEKKKRQQEKVFSGIRPNIDEIQKRIRDSVVDKAKFEKKWKLAPEGQAAYTGVVTAWAKTMNGEMQRFLEREVNEQNVKFNIDPKDPHRRVDLSAEAQLMRYTAGAGLEVNFNPFAGSLDDKRDETLGKKVKRAMKQGRLGLKANAEASFAVAEGKVRAEWYWPHFAGWHMTPEVLEQPFDLGWLRLYVDVVLAGDVGASVMVELDVALLYTADKQGIKGAPKDKKGAKMKTGAGGELNAFAGVKAGVEFVAAVQWMSPEGYTNGKPKKTPANNKAIAEYVNIAHIQPGVAVSAGIGAEGNLKIGFETDPKRGSYFVIRGKLGACFGLGGKGSFAAKVGIEQFGEFIKALAYQLKDADWKKMSTVIEKEAFDVFTMVLKIAVVTGQEVEAFFDQTLDQVQIAYRDALDQVRQEGRRFVERLRIYLQSSANWFSYLPPEGKGALLVQVAELADRADSKSLGAEVIAMAMNTMQTPREKSEVLQHMTVALGDKVDREGAERKLAAVLVGTEYEGYLATVDQRLAVAFAQPLKGRPFLRNNEVEFQFAYLGEHRAEYMA